MLTDINICPINNKTDHISQKYIFYRKKSKTKIDIFPILGRIWSRIRIRIHIKMKQIRNTAWKLLSIICLNQLNKVALNILLNLNFKDNCASKINRKTCYPVCSLVANLLSPGSYAVLQIYSQRNNQSFGKLYLSISVCFRLVSSSLSRVRSKW